MQLPDLKSWAYALINDVCPDRKRDRGTRAHVLGVHMAEYLSIDLKIDLTCR